MNAQPPAPPTKASATSAPAVLDAEKLLGAMRTGDLPSAEQFRELVIRIDHHHILARVFLLDGTPYVFAKSPMKYIIFKEQVASKFEVGSQDVCIVGSARLGFSPAAYKFGTSFSAESDVDVVVVSEELFWKGSQALFKEINNLGPPLYSLRTKPSASVEVSSQDWKSTKEAVRNFVYNNFNPALLPYTHVLRQQIFDSISSTTGLFLALEPQVFVSRIRCRIFRTWKAAEDYYANSLREAAKALREGDATRVDEDESDEPVANWKPK